MAEASAPASSANLGPGFDTLALALEIRCRVVAELASDWRVDHEGRHSPGPSSQDAALGAAQLAVGDDRPLSLKVQSEIPVARGLGSSAAVRAAAALAAWRATGVDPDPDQVFELVARLEGHADNAAATVFGGLQAVTTEGRAHSLSLHPNIVPLVAVPDSELLTSDARAALPDSFTRQAVVGSLQRVVALVEGLRTADHALLAVAAGDEIHEGPRTELNPIAAELISGALAGGALFACWSGAGPSVLAFATAARRSDVENRFNSILMGRGLVLAPGIATGGIR